MAYDIFISYRRNGGYETAKHLYDLLTRDGYSVSFDIDTLRNGDFDTELLKRIDECTDFIIVLNKGAFDKCFDATIDEKHDWLRNELAHALKKKKNIIPVMLNGFQFPSGLPDNIARVAFKNGPNYNQYYFDYFYRKLKEEFLESVSGIFSAKNLQVGIATYFRIVDNDEYKPEKANSKEFDSALVLLRQILTINNQDTKHSFLMNIINLFHQAVGVEKREQLLFSLLGLMMCYYYIDENQVMQNIRKDIEMVEFNFNFWEEYGADIERGAGFVLGAVAAIFGAPPAAAVAMGARSGNELASDTEREIVKRKNRFDNLKREILSIQF